MIMGWDGFYPLIFTDYQRKRYALTPSRSKCGLRLPVIPSCQLALEWIFMKDRCAIPIHRHADTIERLAKDVDVFNS